jgi:ribonuclease III
MEFEPLLNDALDACERTIGYKFSNRALLVSSLTHASHAQHRLSSNERLEFLGDAILGVIVCEHLFHAFPNLLEGELTRIKSVIVSRQVCAEVTRELGVEEYLFLGKGMTTQVELPQSVLSDVFESLVAAIYLDGGWEPIRAFIHKHVIPRVTGIADGSLGDNFKSQLQQLAQRDFGETPVYVLLDEKGPDHSKSFRVAARVGSLQFEAAWGTTKKQAEQVAAKHALKSLSER